MKLELVSFALCPFVHRATITLLEKGVPYATKYIDLKDKPEWFLKISPRGKVPVLVADGTVIFESAVIVEFLDETHPPRIIPEDPFERARQRAWVEPANDLFGAQYELVTTNGPEEFDRALGNIRSIARRFEESIRGSYFAGEALGIVDVAVAPAFLRMGLLESRTKHRFLSDTPKVKAWAERLASRDSVRRGVPDGFEEMFFVSLKSRGGRLAAEL
jgi:glutathione S-transferase